jgi:hypothetical protein
MQMTLAVERGTRQQRCSMILRRAVRHRSNIDRHRGLRGAVAGSTASSIEADLDYGWRRRDCHEVSQRNGCGLAQRGTAAILCMVPPHSGQMAKSIAVNE